MTNLNATCATSTIIANGIVSLTMSKNEQQWTTMMVKCKWGNKIKLNGVNPRTIIADN